MDKGVFTIGCITTEQVLQAVDLAVKMHRNDEIAISCPAYDDINVSIKVVKLIQSYTVLLTEWFGERLRVRVLIIIGGNLNLSK